MPDRLGGRAGLPALAALVVVVGMTVAACGATSTGSSSTGSSTGATPAMSGAAGQLTIHNFAFSPTPLQAKAGTAIQIANTDTTGHTVTADDASFDTKTIAGGATSSITIAKAGTYKYHCDIHNYMQGVIQVTG